MNQNPYEPTDSTQLPTFLPLFAMIVGIMFAYIAYMVIDAEWLSPAPVNALIIRRAQISPIASVAFATLFSAPAVLAWSAMAAYLFRRRQMGHTLLVTPVLLLVGLILFVTLS